MLMLIHFLHKYSHTSHSFCEVSKQYADYSCAMFTIQFKGTKEKATLTLICREVAMYTNERENVFLCGHVKKRIEGMYMCIHA